VIAPYPILPPRSGGKVRILELARGLARAGIDLTMITPFHPAQRRALYAALPFRLIQIPYPYLLPALFTDRPFPYGYLVSLHPGLGRWLASRMSGYDIIQFEHCYLAGLLDYIPSETAVVYNSQNVDSDYTRDECGRPWVSRLAQRRILRLEARLARRACHVFVCCREDGERMQELYGVSPERISTAYNGISGVDANPPSSIPGGDPHPKLARFPHRVIFSGSDVAHNREAVRFILEELAPALRDQCVIVIHGPCGNAFRHTRKRNVVVDTRYDTFDLYRQPTTVGLNPVLQGSGTNLKLLFYLAHGMPVISTEFGVRGFQDLREFVTVEDRSGFADAILRAPSAARPQTEWLMERYGWQNIASEMAKVLRGFCMQPA